MKVDDWLKLIDEKWNGAVAFAIGLQVGIVFTVVVMVVCYILTGGK